METSATIKGWIIADPKVESFSGKRVIKFTVSTKARFKKDGDKKYTNFFDIVYWPNDKITGNVDAEIDKLHKGIPVCFQAEPMQDRWEKDGQKHSRVIFNVDGWVDVLDYKKDSQPGGQQIESSTNEEFEDDILFN